MNAKHSDTRNHILAVGRTAIARKGFHAVGLAELLRAAEVPKGSFYHYFQSKEGFGHALIVDYMATYIEDLNTLLEDAPGNAADRLMAYFSYWNESQTDESTANKCLVVKLSAEICDLSAEMRQALRQGTDQVVARLAAVIEAGLTDGSIHSDAPPTKLAEWLYQLWLGASLLDKLRRDKTAFTESMELTNRLLGRGNR